MQDADTLLAMFSGQIERRDGEAVISVPHRELDLGGLAVGDSYRVAVLPHSNSDVDTTAVSNTTKRQQESSSSDPPVKEGEQHEIEIEDTGEQGDGIGRVGPGYIVFVPETSIGDRVTVEITQARENFAFAEVIEDEPITG